MVYKVLVVDDSHFFQERLKDIINEHPELTVVGIASNGKEAVELADRLQPDIISMDYEMPYMDGVSAVRAIMARRAVPIVMFSSMTYEGARITLDALDAGAVDFISKNFAEVSRNSAVLKRKLQETLLNFARQAKPRLAAKPDASKPDPSRPDASTMGHTAPRSGATNTGFYGSNAQKSTDQHSTSSRSQPTQPLGSKAYGSNTAPVNTSSASHTTPSAYRSGSHGLAEDLHKAGQHSEPHWHPDESGSHGQRRLHEGEARHTGEHDHRRRHLGGRVKIVVIGASTGGPVALAEVLQKLPAAFPVPVVVIQHMPASFTHAFAERLDRSCRVRVKEAKDGDALNPGQVLVAPGGHQLIFDRHGGVKILPGDDRVSYKPSVDITFASAASVFGSAVLGVVMTGMGADGCEGARLLKAKGAFIWGQDQASCVVYGMPKAVAVAGLTDEVLALNEIGPRLVQDF